MRRETQNILLVLLGGALLKISFTGTYLRYVKSSHQWLLITAGVIMVLLAIVSIGRDLVAARAEPTDGAADDHDHHHPARSAWLLLLPVLAVFLIAPPALGSDSVQRAGNQTTSRSSVDDGSALFPALPAGEVVPLPLSDFSSRAAWDSGNSLNGRAIRLVGFIVHDGDASYVARLAIGCCAADAFPIKVKLDGQDLSTLPDDTWVEATVTVQPGSATKENEYIPTATVIAVQQIPQPEDPYEH